MSRQSFSYLPSCAKKSLKLAFTPLPAHFFWKYLLPRTLSFSLSLSLPLSLSLSLSLSVSLLPPQFFLFYSSVSVLPHRNTQMLTCFHSPEQHGHLFYAFLFYFANESELILLSFLPAFRACTSFTTNL